MTDALHILRLLGEAVALVIGASFAIGAICGAGTILIVAGIFDSWDRARQ